MEDFFSDLFGAERPGSKARGGGWRGNFFAARDFITSNAGAWTYTAPDILDGLSRDIKGCMAVDGIRAS